MEEYYINSDTLVLLPIDDEKTKVIELDQEVIINKNIMKIINESCCYFGSSYEGRYQGSKSLLKMIYKLPIIIEDNNNLVIFPTCSFRKDNCCWICLANIENYKKNNKYVIVEFKNKIFVELELSYSSFENQLFRATMLLTKLKKRKEN